MNLKDKVVVIVGGSQGFGKALAIGLIAEGSKIVVVSKNKQIVETTAQEIGAKAFVADVRDEQQLREVANAVSAQFGRIDVWVNSAGVFKKFSELEPIDTDRAYELMDVNFFGAVFGTRTAISKMKSGEGIVINLLSSAALDASRAIGAELYASSKWALRGYIDAVRSENSGSKVKILSVYPGGMKTHLHDEALPEAFDDFMEPSYVVDLVIENIKRSEPELDLIIKRPAVK